MAENTIQKLILGFLVLIVGLALIGSVASNSLAVTDKALVYDEALDISSVRIEDGCGAGSINASIGLALANVPTSWKITDCPITSFSMKNQTGVAAVVTTDYVLFASNGTITLLNTTKFIQADCTDVANDTTISYTYCGSDYMNIAWGRTVLNLVAGFFALALLGAGVGLFYSVARDAGFVS